MQTLHQRGVAETDHLAHGILLAGHLAVDVTLDDIHGVAGDALDDRHTAAGQEGDIAGLGGIAAAGLLISALGAHAVDPAAVAVTGQQTVSRYVGVLRHEGHEGRVPGRVGRAVPRAVAGIALLRTAVDNEVLHGLGIADLRLGDGDQAAGPVGRNGRAGNRRGPLLAGLDVMLRNGQADGGQHLGVQGIANSDDQLVVAIGCGREGQAGRGGLRRHLGGGNDGAVLDGLQGHFIGGHAAGDFRSHGDRLLACVYVGRGSRCANHQLCHRGNRNGFLRSHDGRFGRFVVMVMAGFSDDVSRRHREEHDQNHQHRHKTLWELDVHDSSS